MDRKESGLDLGFEGAGLKQVAIVLGVAFVIALTVMIVKRMSSDALAIVVGIMAGLLATLPTLLLLFFVLLRRERSTPEAPPAADQRAYPPVVIVQGSSPQALPPGQAPGYWPMAGGPTASPERYFQVVGGEDMLDGEWTVRRD
jgi:hypothetical protein